MRIRGANPDSVKVQVKATQLRERLVDLLLSTPGQQLSKEVIETQLNIEGLTVDPTSKDLFLGVKRPVSGIDGRAFLIRLTDPDAWFDGREESLQIRIATTLKLGGGGISSIEWDPVLNGFLLASSTEDNTKEFSGSRLWFWQEREGDLREICRFQNRALEGICRIHKGPQAGNMLLAFDEETFTADWKPKDGGSVAILKWGRR